MKRRIVCTSDRGIVFQMFTIFTKNKADNWDIEMTKTQMTNRGHYIMAIMVHSDPQQVISSSQLN